MQTESKKIKIVNFQCEKQTKVPFCKVILAFDLKKKRCGMIANETVIRQIPSNKQTSSGHHIVFNDVLNSYHKAICKRPQNQKH